MASAHMRAKTSRKKRNEAAIPTTLPMRPSTAPVSA